MSCDTDGKCAAVHFWAAEITVSGRLCGDLQEHISGGALARAQSLWARVFVALRSQQKRACYVVEGAAAAEQLILHGDPDQAVVAAAAAAAFVRARLAKAQLRWP